MSRRNAALAALTEASRSGELRNYVFAKSAAVADTKIPGRGMGLAVAFEGADGDVLTIVLTARRAAALRDALAGRAS